VGAQIATVAMAATDAAFLGHLGPTALAGGGLAASIHATVQIAGAGALTVLAPLIAEGRARGDGARVASVTRHGLALALAFGCVGAVTVWSSDALLGTMDHAEDVARVAAPFLRAVAWSTPFALVSVVLRHVLAAGGRARIVTLVTFGGAMLNAALDALLTGGSFGVPPMGATGVGVATVLANIAMCGALAVAAGGVVSPRAVQMASFEQALFYELVRLGGPAAAMIVAEVAAFQLAGVAVARYGSTWLAAHQLGLTVAWIAFVVPLGVSQAAAIRVAEARAIAGHEASRRTGVVALGLAVSVAGATALVLLLAPGPLVRIFVDVDQAGGDSAIVADCAREVLAVAACFQIFDGVQVVAAGALRGLRDTRVPGLIGVGCYGLLAPLAAWLAAVPLGLGVVGIWAGLAAALAVVAAALVVRFFAVTSTR
jgi:MATE family multidrug resistance protein